MIVHNAKPTHSVKSFECHSAFLRRRTDCRGDSSVVKISIRTTVSRWNWYGCFYTAGDDTSNSILPQNPTSVYTRTIQKIVPFRIRPDKLLASSKLTAPLQLTHTANCAVLRDQFELPPSYPTLSDVSANKLSDG